MKINQHLDAPTLMSFSSGTLSEPLSAVVSAHVDLCSKCQSELKELNLIGSIMLEDLEPTELETPSLAPAVSQRSHDVRDVSPGRPDAQVGDIIASTTVQTLLNGQSKDIAWKWLGPGIKYYKLPLSKGVEGDLRLLKIASGLKLPEHGHNGTELTLVLKGAYRDETGRYGPGDISDLDEDVEHQPIVEQGEECICLVGVDQSARFKGIFSRLLQPLIGM